MKNEKNLNVFYFYFFIDNFILLQAFLEKG